MKEKFPIIKGAENFKFKGNKIGILISHGFVGTPQSVRYLGERLDEFGYSVLGPRLKGHGTHYADLEKCTHEEWFESLEKGYQELKQECRDVFVLGQSMGGTLSLWLAHKYKEIKGIILVNPALTLPSFEQFRGKELPRYVSEGNPDIKTRDAYEITYSKVPIKAIHQLQTLMDITPAILPDLHCPVLGMKSAVDHVVPPENTDYIIDHIGSTEKEMIVLPNSYHVASLDYDKDVIVEGCHRFVQQQVSHRVV
ncbi:alpha/beta fold hydrolase [Bacillus salipaludis]|uniref:Alpha/beta fold hydrolase n=1 Tax=Bacillus salipaludis TaxID=2547811 RepID=A0A4R5VQC3_9BACI|nr:alpha/beta fold hydrolase [Bacillus salipaludis]MDQ6598703.1 alpha/beta fold hydrolase [Bacillus salipaludis]TDK60753.1 alpha/beta fold hydrolase [Bacillus salipaludis]